MLVSRERTFVSTKGVPSVVIKRANCSWGNFDPQQLPECFNGRIIGSGIAASFVLLNANRDLLTIKIHWERHFALVGTMMIKLHAEAGQGFWNCPCVPMRESGKECHCMLFLTPENDFAGQEQTISLEDIRESTANM
ncbi:hypothetical protein RHMOL_Rhmol08G0069600 [Rhododendron molle]|uniref:Uncharacterized protein n=1 Tax=Rhododendron molle TaxID=49168 RepID=A0ACC0MKP3_RHOML|nr:hypothetical protein RHMOL_Rhmol08G0069600 [Rhododendron molle]